MNFSQLFEGLKCRPSSTYKDIFNRLKICFKIRMEDFIENRKHTNRGRKRIINWDKFFDCLFGICDNGFKMSYIKEYYHMSKSTYYYYFDLITREHFIEHIYNEIVTNHCQIDSKGYLITDTFTVKSMDGSEGLGRNPTDRGRKGFKVSLICDQNLVTHAVHIETANTHDSKILVPTIMGSISDLKGFICLADSGYAGQKYISNIMGQTKVKLISKPKRTSNKSIMSHNLSVDDSTLLNQKRNHIERLNGNIRRFRGLMIKYTKKISSYVTYLYVALACITCHRLFIRR